MWWRRSWFSLKGKADIPGQTEGCPATSIGSRVLPVGSLQQRGARLKGLKGRPALKPSGRERASEPKPPHLRKGRRGPVTPRVAVEDQVIKATVPPGSRFKGYADFVVQDLVLRACCIRYRRERWLTPDGQLVVAPL